MKRALLALAAVLCIAAASDPSERLTDPGQEARARALFAQVRCLVCQNESIDDSQAELAHDLRQIVREQVKAGQTDAEIKRFLTDRYGEFVLLRPTLSAGNAALWGGPFLVVGFGLLLLALRLRNRSATAELSEEELSDAEARRLQGLATDDGA